MRRKARRDRLSMVRIYEDIASLGYGGGYDAVRRYAKAWRRRQRSVSPAQAYVPLSFDPGEACQFDWSHEHVALGGVTTKVKAAHMRLCHSRMPVVQIYPREGQEMVFEAHERAFRFFGGVCRRGIYDNMKTAVNAVFVGKGRAYNHRFRQMCSHHLVDPVACTPGAGWEKGQVERQVDHVRGRLFVPRLRGRSYEEINAWLMDECIREAKRCPHPVFKDKTMWQVFEEERPFLMAYRGPFDGFHAVEAGVSKTCLVRFDNHHYKRGCARRRPAGRCEGLCRPHRHPPGWRDRCRACEELPARQDHLQSVALCADSAEKARCSEERRPLQGLAVARRLGSRASPAVCPRRWRQAGRQGARGGAGGRGWRR